MKLIFANAKTVCCSQQKVTICGLSILYTTSSAFCWYYFIGMNCISSYNSCTISKIWCDSCVYLQKQDRYKRQFAIFNTVFVHTVTYGHEFWVMTKRIGSRIPAAETGLLRRVLWIMLLNTTRSLETIEVLQVEPLLLRIERSEFW